MVDRHLVQQTHRAGLTVREVARHSWISTGRTVRRIRNDPPVVGNTYHLSGRFRVARRRGWTTQAAISHARSDPRTRSGGGRLPDRAHLSAVPRMEERGRASVLLSRTDRRGIIAQGAAPCMLGRLYGTEHVREAVRVSGRKGAQ